MKLALCILTALVIGGTASAVEVVIYDSVPTGFRPAVDAAMALGYDVHAYDNNNIQGWINDVADGADIVVFDCHSNYTDEWRSVQLDAIYNYLNTYPNGTAVVALWFMAYETAAPLWGLMGIQYCAEIVPNPMPIYKWVDHPIWNGLPDPLQPVDGGYYVDGARVRVTTGEAIGGFTATAQDCQAGLVAGPGCRTVYIGDTGINGRVDGDHDGIYDWVELYGNIFPWLLNAPSPVENNSTWGAIKSLYR